MCKKLKRKKKTKVMNNSIFKSMTRLIMIVIPPNIKTACCTELEDWESAWFVDTLTD